MENPAIIAVAAATSSRIERYIKELNEVSFKVYADQDVLPNRTIIKVKKDDVMYCKSIDNDYFLDDIYLSRTIRELVNKVENELRGPTKCLE